MKTMKFSFVSMLIAALALTAGNAYAQEGPVDDQEGKVILNGFWDNWFIGAAGGLNFTFDDAYDTRAGFGLDIYVGKWFSPSFGARLGYGGITSSVWSSTATIVGPTYDSDEGKYDRKSNFLYLHGDLLWDIANTILGYKDGRIWSPIPYAHAGYFRTYSDKGYYNNELGAGVGLLNNFRISNRVNITLDIRGIIFKADAIEAAKYAGILTTTAGLSVELGKNKWNTVSRPKPTGAPAASRPDDGMKRRFDELQKNYDNLQAKNAATEAENENLKNKLAATPEDTPHKFDAQGAVFFDINKTTPSTSEAAHLKVFVEGVQAETNAPTYEIVGYIDNATGTPEINQALIEKRVEYVKDAIINTYGVDESKVVIKAVGEEEIDLGSNDTARAVIVRVYE